MSTQPQARVSNRFMSARNPSALFIVYLDGISDSDRFCDIDYDELKLSIKSDKVIPLT
jgi:hypothetical protein